MNFWERNDNRQNNTYNSSESGNQSGAKGNSEQDIRDKINAYGNKSEDELMRELGATAARMKRDGTFDASEMEKLYATASPFLNEEQKKRMRSIIDMLIG